MSKTTVTFEQYVQNHAKARGDAAKVELAKLKKKFPTYANEKQYAKNFPVTHARFQNYVKRGTQAKKAA